MTNDDTDAPAVEGVTDRIVGPCDECGTDVTFRDAVTTRQQALGAGGPVYVLHCQDCATGGAEDG